jgi:hypothetical protein
VVVNENCSEDYCCILCGYKEQSVERLKDHISLHFISQMKHPAPLISSTKSPRSASNGSASTNGSAHEDGAPEPKRIKIEQSISSPRQDTSDEAEEERASKNGVEVKASPQSPLVLNPNGSPSGLLVSPKLKSELRCQACDIGFSHVSNLMAHKKFYCRGIQPIGESVEHHSP